MPDVVQHPIVSSASVQLVGAPPVEEELELALVEEELELALVEEELELALVEEELAAVEELDVALADEPELLVELAEEWLVEEWLLEDAPPFAEPLDELEVAFVDVRDPPELLASAPPSPPAEPDPELGPARPPLLLVEETEGLVVVELAAPPAPPAPGPPSSTPAHADQAATPTVNDAKTQGRMRRHDPSSGAVSSAACRLNAANGHIVSQ